jgi:hypothetical protein
MRIAVTRTSIPIPARLGSAFPRRDDGAEFEADGGLEFGIAERASAQFVPPQGGERGIVGVGLEQIGEARRGKATGRVYSSASPALRRPSKSGGMLGACDISHLTVSWVFKPRASAKEVFAWSAFPSSA